MLPRRNFLQITLLYPKICTEFIKFNNKKTNNLILKWAKDLNNQPNKEEMQIVNGHMKRCSIWLVIREMQSTIIALFLAFSSEVQRCRLAMQSLANTLKYFSSITNLKNKNNWHKSLKLVTYIALKSEFFSLHFQLTGSSLNPSISTITSTTKTLIFYMVKL